MKTGKIASLAIAVLAVVMFGGAAYCFLGGADPSRNMGNYRSFSFYADRPGNAAAGWFQPGAAPPAPWDEFWFDNSGDFNLSAGLNTPGPLNIGANYLTANTLAQLTADANFAGTVFLTSPVTLTGNLTLTCDLRPVNGAVITMTGYTLTLDGGFHAGEYQCFAGTGSVVINSPVTVIPQWFGAVGTSDDTAVVQEALNVAAASRSNGTVLPFYFPPGMQYNFNLASGGLNFGPGNAQVPVSCAKGSPFNGNSTALNFTGNSGIVIRKAGYFANCRVIGGFTMGNGLSAAISSMTSDANGVATITTSTPNSLIVGAAVHIEGITSGFVSPADFIVSSVLSNTQFKAHTGQPNQTAAFTSANIYYYPTVGVALEDQTASSPTICSTGHFHDLWISGFGTALDISAFQNGAGSKNDVVIDGKNEITQALWGILALGNGLPLLNDGSNVANTKIEGTSEIWNVARVLVGGPPSNIPGNIDPEENSFGNNYISGIDGSSDDATDFPTQISIVLTGAYGNILTSNYLTYGMDTSAGLGNIIYNNRLKYAWNQSPFDIGFGNTGQGLSVAQWQGIPQRGGTTATKQPPAESRRV